MSVPAISKMQLSFFRAHTRCPYCKAEIGLGYLVYANNYAALLASILVDAKLFGGGEVIFGVTLLAAIISELLLVVHFSRFNLRG